MGIKLHNPDTVELDVSAAPPGEEPKRFSLIVKYRGRQDAIEYLQSIAEQQATDEEMLIEQVVGWRGVADEDGKDIEFNREALRRALDVRWFFFAARSAMLDEIQGHGVARKN